jgi:hypothetical protein
MDGHSEAPQLGTGPTLAQIMTVCSAPARTAATDFARQAWPRGIEVASSTEQKRDSKVTLTVFVFGYYMGH